MVYNIVTTIERDKCRVCLALDKVMVSIETDYLFCNELLSVGEIITKCSGVEVEVNDGLPQYVCETCIQDATNAYSFKKRCERTEEHFRTQLRDGYCSICSYMCNSAEALMNHLRRHENIKKAFLTCTLCSITFVNQATLDKHIVLQHKSEHSCTKCGTNCRTEHDLIVHLTTHENRLQLQIKNEDLQNSNLEKSNSENEYEYEEDEDYINLEKRNINNLNEFLIKSDTEEEEEKEEEEKEEEKEENIGTECSEMLNSLPDLSEKHFDNHATNLEIFKCTVCSFTFQHQKELTAHVKTHKKFPCHICNRKFTFVTNLRKHCLKHTQPTKWKQLSRQIRTCNLCKNVFNSRMSMLRHRKTHGQLVRVCEFCDENFETGRKLFLHMNEMHEEEKRFTCKVCKKKFFKQYNLNVHKGTHLSIKPHACGECGARFAVRANLCSHKRIHNNQKPYKCTTCKRTFRQHSALRSHEACHSNRRDHICPKCGQTFSRPGAMRNHLKRHNSIKPHACQLCNNKRFVFRAELTRHMRIHTRGKKYACDVCGKSFLRSSNLDVHRGTHMDVLVHKCAPCGKMFHTEQNLKDHIRETHADINNGNEIGTVST